MEIINKSDFTNKKGLISWKQISEGEIIKTNHEIYGYNEFVFIKYDSNGQYLYLIFKEDDEIKKIKTSGFMKGKIGGIINKKSSNYKYPIGYSFNNIIITHRELRKRYRKNGYTENQKLYKYTCNKCRWTEGWIIESDVKIKKGCSCCAGRTAVLGINTIWDTHKWLVDDFGLDEEFAKTHTHGVKDKGLFTCKNCNNKIYKKPWRVNNEKSIGCSCGDGKSYISKYILNLLTQLDVNFKTEVKYEWNKYVNLKNNKLSQASIDFVIYHNGREIPLEADGAFHRSDNKMNGMTKEFHQNIDKQRDENCLKYLGEETIRISDEGSIKENILTSKLAVEFDLSNIDWNKCEEFALSNLVKIACDFKKNYPEMSSKKIGDVIGLTTQTVIKYLKIGNKLKWCNYDSKEEIKNNAKMICNSTKKKVYVFKDGDFIGEYESLSYLSRKSMEIFSVKLNTSEISKSCKKGNKYKGFNFYYEAY